MNHDKKQTTTPCLFMTLTIQTSRSRSVPTALCGGNDSELLRNAETTLERIQLLLEAMKQLTAQLEQTSGPEQKASLIRQLRLLRRQLNDSCTLVHDHTAFLIDDNPFCEHPPQTPAPARPLQSIAALRAAANGNDPRSIDHAARHISQQREQLARQRQLSAEKQLRLAGPATADKPDNTKSLSALERFQEIEPIGMDRLRKAIDKTR
jgi:hypothetical protein